MTERLDPFAAAPEAMKLMLDYSMAVNGMLEHSLTELVKIRASQINGCANCLNMHTVFAREKGETEQRINLLPAWREAPCYSDRERAALGWTEALTTLSEGHTHEGAYQALKAQFTASYRREVVPLAGHFFSREAPQKVVDAVLELAVRTK